MPNLDSLLSFPGPEQRTPVPPVSSHVLVTDTIDSPASFVLVHFLRAAEGKKVIWVGCDANGLGHWKNVVRKSGIQLERGISRRTFMFVDSNEVKVEKGADAEKTPALLKTLYQEIKSRLAEGAQSEGWESETLVIIDDLTALSWGLDTIDELGRPVDVPAQVSRWIRVLRALVAKSSASLITLQHADATTVGKSASSTPDPTDELILRSLLKTADVWIQVKELLSGRARDCDGEITVHPLVRPSLATTQTQSGTPPLCAFAIETPCPSRSKAMLYRIVPDGQASTGTSRVQVWARGTGKGFF